MSQFNLPHPLGEFSPPASFMGHEADLFAWVAVIGASLVAAVIDFRSRRIPNWLTGSVFLCGIVWSGWYSGMLGLRDGLCGAIILALPFIVLFLVAGGGAADAKLMGGVGAWLGISNGCVVLVAVCIAGALLGVGYSVVKGKARGVFCNIMQICFALMLIITGRRNWNEADSLFPESRTMLCIPYGIAIFVGICIAAIGIHIHRAGV